MLYLDINNCSSQEFEKILFDSAKMIRAEPFNSVLSLAVGGEGTPIFTDREMFIQYLCLNAPHMKASAVAGLPALKAEMFAGVVSGSSRSIRIFKTEEEAKEWLSQV
ncbi:MAG TPA: hypothetical protein P5511_06580 [Candidatus Goldiibacteriota bacterium]|nr:hypothetical protein [Candidatus Goldiibacteriota bacterium]